MLVIKSFLMKQFVLGACAVMLLAGGALAQDVGSTGNPRQPDGVQMDGPDFEDDPGFGGRHRTRRCRERCDLGGGLPPIIPLECRSLLGSSI